MRTRLAFPYLTLRSSQSSCSTQVFGGCVTKLACLWTRFTSRVTSRYVRDILLYDCGGFFSPLGRFLPNLNTDTVARDAPRGAEYLNGVGIKEKMPA